MRAELPRTITARLEKLKEEKEEYTFKIFRRRLKRFINVQKPRDHQNYIHNPTGVQKMIQQQNARYSGEVLLSSEKSGMVNQKCIFCEGKHWSHEN